MQIIVGKGCQPLTQELFGENIYENERIGSGWGDVLEIFVCRPTTASRNEVSTLKIVAVNSFQYTTTFFHCFQWRIQDFPLGGAKALGGGVPTSDAGTF